MKRGRFGSLPRVSVPILQKGLRAVIHAYPATSATHILRPSCIPPIKKTPVTRASRFVDKRRPAGAERRISREEGRGCNNGSCTQRPATTVETQRTSTGGTHVRPRPTSTVPSAKRAPVKGTRADFVPNPPPELRPRTEANGISCWTDHMLNDPPQTRATGGGAPPPWRPRRRTEPPQAQGSTGGPARSTRHAGGLRRPTRSPGPPQDLRRASDSPVIPPFAANAAAAGSCGATAGQRRQRLGEPLAVRVPVRWWGRRWRPRPERAF